MSFHVPEEYRVLTGPMASDPYYGNNGAFIVPNDRLGLMGGEFLQIIASDGDGWEHVSVTRREKSPLPPTWSMMCAVKDLFWDEDDTVIQYHPQKSQYVNNHPGCLHLWRPVGIEIPTPPLYMV